jgi:hypothetical protein
MSQVVVLLLRLSQPSRSLCELSLDIVHLRPAFALAPEGGTHARNLSHRSCGQMFCHVGRCVVAALCPTRSSELRSETWHVCVPSPHRNTILFMSYRFFHRCRGWSGLGICEAVSQDMEFQNDDSCKRCFRIAQSFFGKTVAEVVELIAEPKSSMGKDWAEADSTMGRLEADGVVVWPKTKTVHTRKRSGYRMEARYGFMTPTEFLQRFGYECKILKVKTVTLRHEEGTRDITGILFRLAPGEASVYRTVVYFSETVWFLDETVLKPEASSPKQNRLAHFLSLAVALRSI